MVVVDLLIHQPLSVYLIKPLGIEDYLKPTPEMGLLPERVTLKPHIYAKTWFPETIEDVHVIYSPPQDRKYEEWEIDIMRKACKFRKLRFQLHPPPITVRRNVNG